MILHKRRIFKIISAIGAVFIVFFAVLLYLGFIDWKKTLITKISSESTRFIGQEVAVGDLSLSLFKGFTLKDVGIRNPKGFDPGELLHIKRLYIKARYRDLAGGTFHFDRIVLTSPELTIIKDKDGHVNISEKLLLMLKGEEKSETRYHIAEFTIDSGTFEFRRNDAHQPSPPFPQEGKGGLPDGNISIRNVSVHLKDISSDPGEKTLIEASALFSGSTLDIEGWAYLKDTPKTFALSVASEDFNAGAFMEVFRRYRINAEKTRVRFSIHAEGDTEEHMQFTSRFNITGVRSDFLNRDMKDIHIETSGLFNIREDSLNIENLAVRAGHAAEAQMRAIIKDIRKNPSYDVTLKINKIDLSAYNLVPGLQAAGIVSADTIRVQGGLNEDEMRFSGEIRCTDLVLESHADEMKMKNGTYASPSDSHEAVQDESQGSSPRTVKMPYSIAAGDMKSSFKVTVGGAGLHGHGAMDGKDISVSRTIDKRNILKDTFLHSEFTFKGNDLAFRADTRTGRIVAQFSGTVKEFQKKERSIAMQAHLPEIQATDIRESLWDIFPDSLLYAGLDGEITSTIAAEYTSGAFGVSGDIKLRKVFLEGENGEYAVGPINGTVPVAYSNMRERGITIPLPSFERSEYDNLLHYYSRETPAGDYKQITIGSLTYGFKLLENIRLMVLQHEGALHIRHVSAAVFGGRLDGSAVIDISDGLLYRAGMIIRGLSLTRLCDGITPIRGYISGKVDGMAQIKGSGEGVARLIGKADFWTYKTEDEETTISKEFLQQVGGTSVKTYLGDRPYDKGILSLYIKDGFIIFRELEISNRNFIGVKDLSIKVVPLSNKISIGNLMWTIVEAAERAKEK